MNKINILLVVFAFTLLLNGCRTAEKVTATSVNNNVATNSQPEFPGGDEAVEKYFEKTLASLAVPEMQLVAIRVLIGTDGKVKTTELVPHYALKYIKTQYKVEKKENDVILTSMESKIKETTPAEINAELIKSALKMPKWIPAHQNGQPIEKQTEIPVLLIPEDLKETVAKQREKNYDFVGQMPRYPGGENELINYIKQNIQYPAGTSQNKTEGMVVVKFMVSRFGSIKETTIVKSLDPAIDKEVLRLMNDSPRWQPGKQNGVPVNVYFTLPVKSEASK